MSIGEDKGLYKTRISNSLTVIGIILALGWVILLIGIINEGFSGESFVWLLAVLDGTWYWVVLRGFQANPLQTTVNTLKTIFRSFVIVWIIAVATTFLIWGELYTDTILGIVLFLVGTFFMNQANSDAGNLLSAE